MDRVVLVVETVFVFVYFISWLIFINCCVYLSIYLCLSIYAVKIYHKNYIPIKHIQPSYINFMWTLTIFCFLTTKKLYTIYLLSFFLLSTYCISVVFVVVVSITNCFIFEYKKKIEFDSIFFSFCLSLLSFFSYILCVSLNVFQLFLIWMSFSVFCYFFVLYNQHRKYRKFRKSISKFFIFFSSLLPQLKLVYN